MQAKLQENKSRTLLFKRMTPMTRRRWRAFFNQKRALIGMAVFWFVFLISMTAEVWSHHYPLLLIRDVPLEEPQFDSDGKPLGEVKTERRVFFPALLKYSVQDFGVYDTFVVDFAKMLEDDAAAGKSTVALFPLNRWDPYLQTMDVMAAPSRDHYLGTDSLGRDVLARLIYGVRVSLAFGLLVWACSYPFGILIGIVQGYFVGVFDFIVERTKELAEILPFLMVVILINGITKSQSFFVTLGIVLLFFWMGIASQMRAQVLALRRRDFAEAVIAQGGTRARALFKHILPNAMTPIITMTPFTISAGIGALTALDYLGFGLSPPTPSLGELLSQGRTYITNAPWLIMVPTAALVTLLIAINMIGESLRQAFDPRAG